MARSITDIQNALIAQVQADPTLGPLLTSTSRVAIWRLWTYVIAVCQWTLENLYDIFVAEVNSNIANMKPHTAQWYANKAKEFQYGYALLAESDVYDNNALSDDQIAASQVISYAAVIEAVLNNRRVLRIKVATLVNGDLGPVPSDQLAAFTAYMQTIKDAGVSLQITTANADGLQLSVDFYYDPLILTNAGARNDGTNPQPVQMAIDVFLKNLPFNGIFSINQLDNALQAVEGYKDLRINFALAKYGSLPYGAINVKYIPDAGYLRFVNPSTDLTLNFIPYSEQ